ncbi:bifunctional metallophosphatase/5'-nucleotidase [Paenibacillus sp. H1-7]|uniref:bifunctional metallophosphatase/5'-nucleotidase n=1 Tax=Paenibacillus sp. H1-7 TaxID=2282849 RepID=UPI001EF8606C|nr:bifunctional UDP-sugar hydrolase/5'-nucleotidase [Paenibacillus sp. H1-7]ULL14314.1 bifunctional metallophosphatase/5'-nucleotidase [Paenibacillus sp. H1-7]
MSTPHLRLRILHSNDIHSHFEQMPGIAAVFQKLRDEAGEEHTLTLDIGDHMDRMRPETEASGGKFNLEIMAATGYEAVTLGNNEGLTFTREALAELYGGQNGPAVLVCNLLDAETGAVPSWGAPYHITEKSGLRIGMIGATAYYDKYYRLLGWDILQPLPVIKKLVQQLRPQVDVIIVLSHLGLRQDELIAAEVDGIDVILGGHSHHLLEQPLHINGALVCGAGKFGQYIGVVDMEFHPETRKAVRSTGYVRKVDGQRTDPVVAETTRRLQDTARRMLDEEVAYLEEPIHMDWNREAPLGNMLAAVLRKWTDADIGIANAGQLLDHLGSGKVTAGRLLDICPSPVNPCRITITGELLLQALEESLLPEFQEKPIYGFGFRGKVLGMLNVDGLSIHYDGTALPYSKIKSVWIGGEPLVPDRTYKVGTLDMFTFGIGYLSLSKGTDVKYFLPEFLRDIIRGELNDKSAIRDGEIRRWIPAHEKDC